MRLAALVLVLVVAVGCDAGSSRGPAENSETRTAMDDDAKVRYELAGSHLRVEVLPDAPRFEDLFLGRGAFTFACATDPYGSMDEPAAQATAEFSAETRSAAVELSRDVSADVILCYAEAPGGAIESEAWFVDPEELYGIHIPSEEEQAANEARAKAATDCVAFIKQIHQEFGVGRDKGLLYPGEPATVPVKAYWFGPRLDERRATYADSSLEVDFDENTRKVKLPLYTVMYQRPEDGCQSTALVLSSDEDLGFGVGHEIQLQNMPADSPSAQIYLSDPDVLGRASSYRTRLSNGEEATVYFAGGVDGLAILTKTTLIELLGGGYGNERASRRVVPLLRPVSD